jgi:excisionase family DNA binding protein
MACVTIFVFSDPELTSKLLDRWWNMPPGERIREFWPVKEIAYKLGVSSNHIRKLADEGKLPGAIKPRGRWVVHHATLLASMKTRN